MGREEVAVYKRTIQIVGSLGCWLVMAGAGVAQNDTGAPDLPLGLERLHWGDSISAAQAMFPGLRITSQSQSSGEPRDQSVMVGVPYRYGDCQFLVGLSFYRDKLDEVFLRTPRGVTARCQKDVADGLNAHFASGNKPIPADNDAYLAGALHDSETYVSYFSTPGQRIEMRLDPVEDVSGRRAAGNTYARCQSIQVTVDVPAGPPTGTRPQTLPDRDLGCVYPTVATRLREEGAVKLVVCIETDGSVSSVRITEANKSPRLNEAAVRIATDRLQFLPELQDGGIRAVASCPAITIAFSIIHPIVPNQR